MAACGFTLLELLAVVTIIAALVAILAAAVGRVRAAAKNTVCKSKLKTVSFEFIQFADESNHLYRGDSEDGRKGFYLEDFQECLYGISEFWKTDGLSHEAYEPSDQPMICAAGPQGLTRWSRLPCSKYAVRPAKHISIALNKRLERASVQIGGWHVLMPVRLTERVLEHSSVPLAFDVDGAKAHEDGVLPYYAAPPAGGTGVYASGKFWFPSRRHRGRLNACFVGGHVLSSSAPEKASGWDWEYQHPPQ